MLVAIFGAALTIFEYSSTYPGLVEFREAPPFNRIRFVALFVTVFLLTLLVRGQTDPTTTTEMVAAVGGLIAPAMDFPYSPGAAGAPDAARHDLAAQIELVRIGAGISLSHLAGLAGGVPDRAAAARLADPARRLQRLGQPADLRPDRGGRRGGAARTRRPR